MINLSQKLTANFSLSEVVNWADKTSMGVAEKEMAKKMAIEALTPEIIRRAGTVAADLQKIRDWANASFPEYKGKIGLTATSWFRPKKWELYRKRSGGSQHIFGWAVDFIVSGIPPADIQKVMKAIFKHLTDWPGGLALKVTSGKFVFIHIDKRKVRARWTY